VDRRGFVKKSAIAAFAASWVSLEGKGNGLLSADEFLSFDFHAHPGLFFAKNIDSVSGDAALAKTIAEMKEGKLSGAFFSLVADWKLIKIGPDGVKPARSFAPNEAWNDYTNQVQILKTIIQHHALKLATRGSDLESSLKKNEIAAYLSCEGGDFLEGQVDRLEKMYEDGVRSVQLVHYTPMN
jgi:membrane dipeptidase